MSISISMPASKLTFPFNIPGTQTTGISMRPPTVADAPLIVEAVQESLPELRGFMPWAYSETTVEFQRSRIAGRIADYWRGIDFTLGVHLQPTNQFVGSFGLHARASNPKALEIGFWVRSSLANNGLATLVSQCLVVYGFEYLGLERIQCGHDIANSVSARVNEKCGFIVEAELPGYILKGEETWRELGWQGTGTLVMRRLLPHEAKSQPWYEHVKSQLKVYNWLGELV